MDSLSVSVHGLLFVNEAAMMIIRKKEHEIV